MKHSILLAGLGYGYVTIVTSQHIKNRILFFKNNFEMVPEIVCVDCDDCDLLLFLVEDIVYRDRTPVVPKS